MTDHAGAPRIPDGLDEREAEIYRLSVVNRLTQTQIGERLGINQQRVSQILQSVKAKLPPLDTEELRRASIELHHDTIRRAFELAEREGAPVFVGKDGTMATDTDGTPVRDYALRLSALETARKADVELRKLLGLDAATKQEISGSVRYEVLGVSLDALT